MIQIKDIPRSKVVKVRYTTEDERGRVLGALESLNVPVEELKYAG